MLQCLSLSEFVIVPHLSLELGPGFTALTGETGAGKSILIDALQLLLGARADTVVIREGAPKTEVSAIFSSSKRLEHWLAQNGFDPDKELLLRRTLDSSGRSRAWINGSPATATQMRALGERLIDIHGQHSNQSLLKPQEQLRLLDAHGEILNKRNAVRELYETWQEARRRLESASSRLASLQEEMNRLSWMSEDLEALAPEPGEWERISEEHTRLANASSIVEGVGKALGALSDDDDASAASCIGQASSRLESLARYDPRLENLVQQLSDASSIVDDAVSTLRQYLDSSDLDEERFAELDRRLSAFYDTARKFHARPEDLAQLRSQVKEKLAALEQGIDTEGLSEAEKEARGRYMQAAADLSRNRKKAAASLSREVTKAMQVLSMEGGRLEVKLSETEPGPFGLERCDFLVAGHAGVTPRELTKVASGGELSRISLAIAVITAKATPVGTLIFDEVDAGIGGAVAEVVGRFLQTLGRDRQVICVTHQPQVACCAGRHLHVEKQTADGVTTSSVKALGEEERVTEIARMLGGIRMTQATIIHAREMLKNSAPSKGASD